MIVLAGLISMVLNFVFLNYVDKLEQIKCGCSNDWRREYIKVYSLITIVIVTTGLFLDVMNDSTNFNSFEELPILE